MRSKAEVAMFHCVDFSVVAGCKDKLSLGGLDYTCELVLVSLCGCWCDNELPREDVILDFSTITTKDTNRV